MHFGLQLRVRQRLGAILGNDAFRVALGRQGPRLRELEAFGAQAELGGLLQLDFCRREITVVQGGDAEQVTRLGIVRILLERVPELDDGGVVFALGEVFLCRRDELDRVVPAAAGARQRESDAQKRLVDVHRCISFRPNRLSRSYSVGRLMPRSSAARLRFPLERESTRTTASRSAWSRTSFSVGSASLAGAPRPKSAAPRTPPSAMITARLTQFCSSRTLPGQLCASMAAAAWGSSVMLGRLCSSANWRTKAWASSTASPCLSRRGGIFTTISASR